MVLDENEMGARVGFPVFMGNDDFANAQYISLLYFNLVMCLCDDEQNAN